MGCVANGNKNWKDFSFIKERETCWQPHRSDENKCGKFHQLNTHTVSQSIGIDKNKRTISVAVIKIYVKSYDLDESTINPSHRVELMLWKLNSPRVQFMNLSLFLSLRLPYFCSLPKISITQYPNNKLMQSNGTHPDRHRRQSSQVDRLRLAYSSGRPRTGKRQILATIVARPMLISNPSLTYLNGVTT